MCLSIFGTFDVVCVNPLMDYVVKGIIIYQETGHFLVFFTFVNRTPNIRNVKMIFTKTVRVLIDDCTFTPQ